MQTGINTYGTKSVIDKTHSLLSDGTLHRVSREPELDERDLASTCMLSPLAQLCCPKFQSDRDIGDIPELAREDGGD